jgi:hypothetical protein
VYEGKSLILLSKLARPDERVLGFDIFPGEMLETAKKNITTYGALREVNLRVGDTSKLEQKDVVDTFPNGVRILHIDAGHEYYEVRHQLAVFAPVVSEGGCIIMDDYQDREYPGIEAAVLDFCEIDRPRRFVPFFAGANKMYLCERHMAVRYQENLLQHDVFADKSRTTRVRDFTILVGFSKAPLSKQACLNSLIGFPYIYTNTGEALQMADFSEKYGELQQAKFRTS